MIESLSRMLVIRRIVKVRWTDTGRKEVGERERERERGGKMKRGKDKCGAIFRQVDFNGRRILITFTE